MIKINSKNKITYSILTVLIFCIGNMNLNSVTDPTDSTDPNSAKLDDKQIKIIKNDILKININIINLIIKKRKANFANGKPLNYAKSVVDHLSLIKTDYELSAYLLLTPDPASSSKYQMRYNIINDKLDDMFNKIKQNKDNTFRKYIELANIMFNIKNKLKTSEQISKNLLNTSEQISKNLLNRYLQILRKQIMYLKFHENTESLKNFLDEIAEKIRYLINEQLKSHRTETWPNINDGDYHDLGITEESKQELEKYFEKNPIL